MKIFQRYVGSLAIIVLTLFMLVGCGGGTSGGSGATTSQDGELAVSLTDAPGDFLSYTVDVVSLTLTRANGTQVATLPLTSRIDFSQYTEMTEFLTMGTVPAGVYVAATLTLDYQNADIRVEDENGDSVEVETIVDSDGNPITTLEVSVRLEDRNRLVIAPGVPAHLLLDFNLEATNQVSFDVPGVPTLTVDPFLVADVGRTGNKLHRVRGLLNEVSVADSSFSVFLRPFYCALSGNHRRFGVRSVSTDAETLFDVDGVQYVGADGLIAMEGLDPLAAVVAVGDLRFNPLRFEATEVYAGTSVPGGDKDVVKGSVISREGNTLTVKGATLIRNDSSVIFNDQVTVQVGEDTIVTRQLSADPFDIDDISVGQKVVVFGELTNSDPLALELNADPGFVRMLITTVRGHVNTVDEADPVAQLTMDLQSINHRRLEIFDFTGTGTDPANDADPADYQIDTGSIDLSPFSEASPVKVRGFVQPFGQAPADFNAQTIIGVGDVRALMRVDWRPASENAFDSVMAEALVLNFTNVGRFHHLIRGWLVTDLTALDQPVSLVPRSDGTGLFVIRFHGIIQVFLTFDEYSTALAGYLEDSAAVHKLGAVGAFDDATATLTADVIEIRLN